MRSITAASSLCITSSAAMFSYTCDTRDAPVITWGRQEAEWWGKEKEEESADTEET